MSTLLLVRHGQARAFDADSDRLSELGAEQAKRLGQHWVASGVELDEIHVGTLVRQRQTAELVAEAYAKAGRAWPELRSSAAWNEYDAGGILGKLMPLLAKNDETFARLVNDFQAAAARPDRNRYFQRMFEALMDRWEQGALVQDGVEPFAVFHARVSGAFQAVTAGRASRRVAVFTSGGPIGVCTQIVLDAPPRTALRLNWRVRNASLTEMIFSEGRTSLQSFNVDHYLEAELRTFR
jgi:broad specificity phosphatase PhoE